MPCEIDASKWSGEGAFTQLILDRLRGVDTIALLRVEDAPATRSEADYNFISNEIFVRFTMKTRQEPTRRFGFLPASRSVVEPTMTMASLEAALTNLPDVGAPEDR